MITTSRPAVGEYASSFAGYIGRIGEDEDILAVLATQLDEVLARFKGISDARGDYRYAPDKWSMKEVVGHLSDTERVLAYRALRFGRGDATPLPSFDDQAYVPELHTADRALDDMAEEWGHVRRATLALYRHLPATAWSRRGIANDQPISVRALAYVIAGHVRHHLQTLEMRYT